jgi:putative aldouronate transport system permease protein
MELSINVSRKNNRVLSIRRIKMDYPLYLMLLVPVVLVFIYHYIPMVGILIAFKNYLPGKGFFESKWVGLGNFRVLFNMPGFFQAIRNTLLISVWKIALSVIVPVTFTLLLNEIAKPTVKKGIQTLIYLPHFISWVLLAGIFIKLLGGSGIVNKALGLIGIGPIIFLGDNSWFRFTIILTDIWKEFGYGTIVYLAAVSAVNPNLYEAATIDGAGYWKQMVHVTLPALIPIIVLMTVLKAGSILNAGFDQIFNLYNTTVYESGDIIDTLVYRIAFGGGKFSLSTAAGLSKSVVAALLVILSHKIAYKVSGYRVF